MRALGTVLAVLAALLWSAAVWGSYGILSLSTDFLANGGIDTGLSGDATALSNWIAGVFERYGTVTAGAIWALGLLAILVLRAIYNWIIGLVAPNRYERGFDRSIPASEGYRTGASGSALPPAGVAPDTSRWSREPPRR